MYKRLASEGSLHSFEVVFISSDADEKAFTDYFKTMPWIALPFAERGLKESLSKRFGVSSIPLLILLDGRTGEVISKEGRKLITECNDEKKFPWPETPAAAPCSDASAASAKNEAMDKLFGSGKLRLLRHSGGKSLTDTTAAVVEGGDDVGDDGPNTDSSNVRECLRRERATMLMCACLCLSCIFVSKCPKIEPLSLSVQLILRLLCPSSSSNPPSPDSSSSSPSFAGSTDSCTACQVSDKCLTDN